MQQDVFPITELDTISFECTACRTEVILSADRPREKGHTIVCPLCHREIPGATNLFDRYQAAFEDARKLGADAGATVKLRARPATTR